MAEDIDGDTMLSRLGAGEVFHPQRRRCVEQALAWMEENRGFGGLVSLERIRAWNFGDFGSAMYPGIPVEFATLGANLTNAIAVIDDMMESDPECIESLRAAVLDQVGGGSSHSSLAEGWCSIASTLTAGTTTRFRERLRAACALIFDANAWEAQYRRSGRIPGLEELIRFRPEAGGMPIYLLILERGVGGPLDDEIIEAAWFRSLNEKASQLACWVNDILSFHWDRAIHNPINLVRVLEEGAARTDPIEAWDYFHRTWGEMQALRGIWLQRAPEQARAYLEQLPDMVTGVIVWMRLTRRYALPKE